MPLTSTISFVKFRLFLNKLSRLYLFLDYGLQLTILMTVALEKLFFLMENYFTTLVILIIETCGKICIKSIILVRLH